MKKLFAVLLILALLLCGAFLAYAIAETAEGSPAGRPLVDLTGVLVAVVLLVFDFLLVWIARVIIPPIKTWLQAHTTEKQRGLLWDAVCKFVDAAEQTILGPGRGKERLEYVVSGLEDEGFTVDFDMIEAAVKRMKERMAATVHEAILAETEDGYDLPPLEEWPLEMIVDFCRLNDIPHAGCETKDEYIEAIVAGGRPLPGTAEVSVTVDDAEDPEEEE